MYLKTVMILYFKQQFELLVHQLVQELFILVLSTLSIYLSISYHTNFLFKICMKWSYTLTPPPTFPFPKVSKNLVTKKNFFLILQLNCLVFSKKWHLTWKGMHGLFIINDTNRFTSQSEVIYFSKCESHKNTSKLTKIPHTTQKFINNKQ